METKVAPFAATPDSTFGHHCSYAAPDQAAAQAEPPGLSEEEADLRLVIEEDEAGGTYVYKTVNRRTGAVVQQLPREEVLRLRNDAAYTAGGVIRTKA